ncbi:DUF2637 domain-containing protein [Streptomyces sp. NBC_01267]|uniref:DUF2637 domain-containing protein n=1 Tax=Streptomyces sp. NBC_01267 TaxID=2903805 RepID=UPI002E320CE6|nr:DUF2637 domain-containing protein [Streptomyces sp. NBC_01267]
MRPTLRRLADPILLQAAIAGAISFAHIHDIAEAAGQTGWKAWGYPISVDLLMVMAWRQIRTPGNAKRGPWLWFGMALTASLSANVAEAGVLDMHNLPVSLRVIIAGWPALAFFGGTLLLHSRKALTDEEAEPQAPAVEPAPVPDVPMPTQPVEEPQRPKLVSYADAAKALDVAPETVRGWKAQGKIKAHQGPTANSVLVDLNECATLQGRRPVSV